MSLNIKRSIIAATIAVGSLLHMHTAWANEDLDAIKSAIHAKWTQTMPVLPVIEEVRTTPIKGLYELHVGGTDILYSNADGSIVMYGEMFDLATQRNLTQERVDRLSAIDFSTLPLENAIVFRRGDGSRKIAVFEDPGCGYCHKFEQQMQSIDNVTVYVFLYPILSTDSFVKSRNIWCAEDQKQAWQDWMLRENAPAKAECDTQQIQQNLEFGRKYRITGTPTLIFSDGSRIPGAVAPQQIEAKLASIETK